MPVCLQRDDLEGGGILLRKAVQIGAERIVGRYLSAAKVAIKSELGRPGDGILLEGSGE